MAYFRCIGGNGGGGEELFKSADVNMALYSSSGSKTINVNVHANAGSKIVFVVAHRSNITDTPTGCTKIYETASASASVDNQRISFYEATFDSTCSIIGNFKQSSSNRFYLTYVIFRSGTTFAHSGDYLSVVSTAAVSFNAPDKTPNAKLLWAVSMNSMDSSGSCSQFTSPNDILQFSYPAGSGNSAPRLAVYYDDGTGAATGRTFYNDCTQYDTACVIDAIEIL